MASELDPVAALWRSMAEDVTRTAPSGWRSAVLTCEVGEGPVRGLLAYRGPDGAGRRAAAELGLPALGELAEELAGELAGELSPAGVADVELTVLPSGDYEVVVAGRNGHGPHPESGGHVYVLDPSHLPPQPGQGQTGPRDAAPAGDPVQAVRLLRELLRVKYEILGLIDSPRPPAAAGAGHAARLREWAGVAPPADLCALYEVADGDPLVFNGYEWPPLEELTDPVRGLLDARERRWHGWDLGWDDTVLDAEPPGVVRRVTGHPGWIPFAHDGGGNLLAVDMAPAAGGRPGQVIQIGRDFADGPGYLADSVTGLLRMELETIGRGDYDAVEDSYLELFGPEWDHTPARNARERRIDARRATLGSLGPQVQRLVVRHGADLDLSGLANAPLLHDARLTCRAPDLSPLLDLPLDNLALTVDAVDLAPLAGHPTLRTLTLATRRPVDVSPLSAVPLLNGLHLAGAAVTDLGVLAEMGALRYLVLDEGQWRELRGRTGRLPPLAAAGLAGETERSVATRWAAGFPGFRPPRETRLTGRLVR